MRPTVLWFRRDLRLADHLALLAALDESGGPVVPLFVLDDALRGPAGPNRLAFLYRSLRSLDQALGGRLVVRPGPPEVTVPALAAEAGATTVHVSADFGPYGRVRDDRVAQALAANDVGFVRTGSPYRVDPGRVLKSDGQPFRVFSPFLRAWKGIPTAAPAAAPTGVDWRTAASSGVPDDPAGVAALPPAGESAAHARIGEFLERISAYADERDRPDVDGTSRLSVYLKYGLVHPRQVLQGLGRTPGAERFLFEVAWRDFYADVLWHRPDSAREALQPAMAAMPYDEGPSADARFAAWAAGRTGYPIVDAGIRQLLATGWMHNRVRMVVASFLVKDLHIDWRRGARFFLHHLVDGDLASNNHGWQWVAGTGTDPSPYHRVFNPVLQGEKFDPTGAYLRQFIPELAPVPDRYVHHPWDGPSGPPIGYPEPIVDHAEERREALLRYQSLRS